MKVCYYSVADFVFSVSIPDSVDAGRLLPSFRPFVCDGSGGRRLFDFVTTELEQDSAALSSADLLIEESLNDLGFVRLHSGPGAYLVSVASAPGGVTHFMRVDGGFSRPVAHIVWSDRMAGFVLSSMLRIVYSQAVLLHDAFSVHASAVYADGKAFLFMGESGTGKSTHAALWLKHVPGCGLLNDDNPAVRVIGGVVKAYGTPWSGKTHCYKNLSFPVGGMVRLCQAPANRFMRREGAEAFIAVYPGCSAITGDRRLSDCLCDTLVKVAELVPVATLECLPDRHAALLCRNGLVNVDKEK